MELNRYQQQFRALYPQAPMPAYRPQQQQQQGQEKVKAPSLGGKRIFRPGSAEITSLAAELEYYFSSKGYETQNLPQPNGAIVQGKKGKGIKQWLGLANAATVTLENVPEGLQVQIGSSEWLKQGTVIGVGVFLFPAIAVTGGIGMLQQQQLTEELWRIVEGHVTSRGGMRVS
jgi:hypothetical protein